MVNRKGKRSAPSAPDMSTKKFGICRLFPRGSCHYGAHCKFSHDVTEAAQAKEQVQKQQAKQTSALRGAQLWKNARPKSDRDIPQVTAWINTALDLVLQGPESLQQVVVELASARNLKLIAVIVETGALTDAEPTRTEIFQSLVMPLFNILGHSDVSDNATLEDLVRSIYSSLLGDKSTTLTLLFHNIIDMVENSFSHRNSPSPGSMQALNVSACLLSKFCKIYASGTPPVCLKTIHETLSSFVGRIPATGSDFYGIQTFQRLEEARVYLSIGLQLNCQTLHSQAVTNNPRNPFSSGLRHDNDAADIADIKLLPTLDEIKSLRPAYLPSSTASKHNVKTIDGLLDRQFRFLREDVFRDLRDAVRTELDRLAGREPGEQTENSGSNMRSYDSPRPENIGFSPMDGLKINVSVPQPHWARGLDKQKRIQAWTQPPRLAPGALVCAVDDAGDAVFLLVSYSTRATATITFGSGKNRMEAKKKIPPRRTLADEPDLAFMCLEPVEQTAEEIGKVLAWYKSLGGPQRCVLLEFPNLLVGSALPPLRALQNMSVGGSVPFQDILVKPENFGNGLPAPLYTLRPGFSYNLGALCNDVDASKLKFNPSDDFDPAVLSQRSSLDPTQSVAVLNTLKSSLAITQGPPGTGKSYTGEALIKILLASKKAGQLGPIICVCYTNHALDQLLEHLLDAGVEGIVRMGAGSKSEQLEPLTLTNISRRRGRTAIERKALSKIGNQVSSAGKRASGAVFKFKSTKPDDMVAAYLLQANPLWHRDLFGAVDVGNNNGFSKVKKKKKQGILQAWVASGSQSLTPARPLPFLLALRPSDLTHQERIIAHQHLIKAASQDSFDGLVAACVTHAEHRQQENSIRAERNVRCLQDAQIIGVTNVGLARNIDVLKRTGAKVLACEEAAEVLEGILLTALLPSIEHAIFIGDHQQLRPQVQNWSLQSANPRGAKYGFDISLFERLVNPRAAGGSSAKGIPFSMLETQRRMHPSISKLIRTTLYPSLVDADNVKEYPEVRGVQKRLFWLHHEHPEVSRGFQDAATTSQSNDHEIQMVSALVSHLIRQGGYEAGDIAVLTPYLSQLNNIRHTLENTLQVVLNDRDTEDLEAAGHIPATFEDSPTTTCTSLDQVRAATVDNFQGEQAKIIIISLVRSNAQQRPGFLSTSNRINVLLSRAQHGMYIIGNARTFANVPMWSHVLDLLRASDALGPALPLQCPRHPDAVVHAAAPADFDAFCPGGGCRRPCEQLLRCGHACTGPCHSDVLHAAVICAQPCIRALDGCDHACPRRCNEPCPETCHAHLTNLSLTLGCGHTITSAPCWQAQNPEDIVCKTKVNKTVPGCGHSRTVECNIDVTSSKYNCPAQCGRALSCGHICRKPCFACRGKTDEAELLVREDGEVVEMARCDECGAAVGGRKYADKAASGAGAVEKLRERMKKLKVKD